MNKTVCAIALAMTAATLSAGDLERQAEIAGFAGGLHIFDGGGDHGVYGGYLGYGVSSPALVFFEASHSPLDGGDLLDFNAGVKFSLLQRDMFEPYALVALGGGHFSAGSFSETRFGVHAGFGTRVYVGRSWGIQPEVRWARYFFDGPDVNTFRYTGGVFYQWGR
jgi:hypothetical protein